MTSSSSLLGRVALFTCALPFAMFAQPVIEQRGEVQQLIVQGKPFLMRGGEVFNSSSSDLAYMEPIWDRLAACHVNTVLAPISWEQFEPVEGEYDFALLEGMIHAARAHKLRLVILWFGTWKNLVSSYAPAWVRSQPDRFPMVKNAAGQTMPMLSTFGDATLAADTRAFVALIDRIRDLDAKQETVLLVQVQNEVGLPSSARDRSPAAEAAFAKAVPPELLAAFTAAGDSLPAVIRDAWSAAGSKRAGTWVEVFGANTLADELFMSWYYARYIGRIAAAGKARYPIPMFVNGALGRANGEVGSYPSGGPMPWFVDVWRTAAPAIDFIAPDIYARNFVEWAGRFSLPGNPLFVPEMFPIPANAVVALGRFKALGVSPFGVEGRVAPGDEFARLYELVAQLEPLILQHQASGSIGAASVNQTENTTILRFGAYAVTVKLRTPRRDAPAPTEGYALVIAEDANTFVVLGREVDVTFALPDHPPAMVALDRVEEGSYRDGQWTPGRRLNGDEIMLSYAFETLAPNRLTGTGLRFDQPSPSLQRASVFKTR